jgi:molybdate transport system substrate-binding protein
VFAAASTRGAIEQIGRDFEEQSGIAVRCEADASSDLARKIEEGADADLFLSADEPWADYLQERGMVEKRRNLLANRLVVIVPASSNLEIHKLTDLEQEGVRRVALALEPVPAGRYARQALKKAGVWPQVEKRTIEGSNVRAVLTHVERDEADAGMVYGTDARAAGARVRVALTVPAEPHAPIRYPLVLLRRAAARPEARRLYEYLSGEKAGKHWQQAGFEVPH